MSHKYLILFPINGAHGEAIKGYMRKIEAWTNLPAPYHKLPPHVTFHKPIERIAEERVLSFAEGIAKQSVVTRLRYTGVDAFGKHFIVLPIIATVTAARLWTGLGIALSCLPEYEHGPFDADNTLHVTIAEKTSAVFDDVWHMVRGMPVEPADVTLDRLAVYRKPLGGGSWEELQSFALPA